jgi:hypothetical protein
MPGTGPLRRSSVPAWKKAIVGMSRVEPDRLQRPSFVFLAFAMIGFTLLDLHGIESLTKSNGKLGCRQFPSDRGILRFFGDVAQCQIDQLGGCLITRKMAPGMVAATNCERVGDQSRNGAPVSAPGKPGHFDRRLEEGSGSKTCHRETSRVRAATWPAIIRV